MTDPARIIQGAGNYDAMCTGCHLKPGMAETELSKGLYPAPPNLSSQNVEAGHAFWVIKHGIKASGMPSWGKSMEDEYIWNMVAFLKKLPTMKSEEYSTLVASSGGHSHGGGESQPHGHAEAMSGDHHGEFAQGSQQTSHAHPPGTPSHEDMPAASTNNEGKAHAHPPGTPADHHGTSPPKATPAPAAAQTLKPTHEGHAESHPAPQSTKADDGHDHQH